MRFEAEMEDAQEDGHQAESLKVVVRAHPHLFLKQLPIMEGKKCRK